MTDEALYTFVAEHQNDDIAKLLFAYKSRDIGIDIREAVTQIECRRKTAAKLPHFNAHKQFYYPSLLAAEQSSMRRSSPAARLSLTLLQGWALMQ